MKRNPIFLAAAAVVFSTFTGNVQAQANIPADYLSIIGATAGTLSDGYGSPGSIPVHGRASFPLLIDADNVPALAAGRYGNGVSATAARAVAGGAYRVLQHQRHHHHLDAVPQLRLVGQPQGDAGDDHGRL